MTKDEARALAERLWPEGYTLLEPAIDHGERHGYRVRGEPAGAWGRGLSWEEAFLDAGVSPEVVVGEETLEGRRVRGGRGGRLRGERGAALAIIAEAIGVKENTLLVRWHRLQRRTATASRPAGT